MAEGVSSSSASEGINLVETHLGNEYDSSFEYDSEAERKRLDREDLAVAVQAKRDAKASRKVVSTEYDKEEKRRERHCFLALDAYTRHKKLINDYLLCYPGTTAKLKRDASRDRTDFDIIRENHRFLWDETADDIDSWEKQLAKRYYDKLFKEYCICDLTYYKANKIAMRWRTEQEVIDGTGQFSCGEKKCKCSEGMRTWEVNFAYLEQNEKKNALVKLRLCSECSFKLNYRFQRKELTKQPEKRKVGSADENESGGKKSRPSGSAVVDAPPAEKSGGEEVSAKEEEENIWAKPNVIDAEKSQEEEFDAYLADMFM
ncbi:protein FRA10AC1 homolog [Ornithodoros turicata]